MLPGEREVGGLRCSQVLERLSEYLDGELPADAVAKVVAHVSACHVCEQFGGMFAGVVAALREVAGNAESLTGAERHRLAARLKLD